MPISLQKWRQLHAIESRALRTGMY